LSAFCSRFFFESHAVHQTTGHLESIFHLGRWVRPSRSSQVRVSCALPRSRFSEVMADFARPDTSGTQSQRPACTCPDATQCVVLPLPAPATS
jgi:hypothetical protein